MCYYNGIKVSRADYIRLKQLEKDIRVLKLQPRLQNGFDYSDFPIIKPNNNDWDFINAHWEFIPSWINSKAKLLEHRKKYTTLNAKAENILDSKMFRDAALNRRCLVLSSYFVEWRHYKPEGEKKELKYPYHITLASETDEPLFFMAGICNESVDFDTGEQITSFAIVTTVANELMEQIHNTKKRMPTILTKSLAEEWISDGLTEERINEIAKYKYDSEEMIAWTIDRDFLKTGDAETEVEYKELIGLYE